jgi:hypothetical protein
MMLKQFELTLVHRDDKDFEVRSINRIEANSLLQLASQVIFLMAAVSREEKEYERIREIDTNDIPF